MYRIDNSTAATSIPTPAAAGTAGYFTGGNPATGVAATILDADFMNMIQEELVSVAVAGGQTLSKTTYNQLLLAIENLIEARSGNYVLDTGVANAYVVALSPPITTYTNGLQVRFRAGHANTTGSTLNAGGGVVGLLNDVGGALASGDIPLGAVVTAVYDSTAGAFLITTLVPSQALTQGTADARYLQLSGGTLTGKVNFAVGASIASAGTLNLSTATGNTVHVTGTTATSAVTLSAGQWIECIADAAWPLTYNAATNKINTAGANYTCSPGDSIFYFYDGTTVYGQIIKADGTAVTGNSSKIQSLTASVASNALTVNLAATSLDFRNATLSNGTPNSSVSTGALSITVPSSATLGTVSAQQARLVLLVAYNGGTPVLCIANLVGGVNLDETTLISPTTISAGATANNVIYSASAVSANSPFRVVGFVDVTETIAGTWATAPTTVQGAGGEALVALSSIGYGQTWQLVTRTSGTTYYNTTGKPILLKVDVSTTGSGTLALTINGTGMGILAGCFSSTGTQNSSGAVIIPAGASYSVTVSGLAIVNAYEMR